MKKEVSKKIESVIINYQNEDFVSCEVIYSVNGRTKTVYHTVESNIPKEVREFTSNKKLSNLIVDKWRDNTDMFEKSYLFERFSYIAL